MKLLLLLIPIFLFSQDLYYYQGGKKTLLTPRDKNTLRSLDDTLYFKNSRGINLGISKSILIKLNKNTLIIDIENRFRVKFIKKITPEILLFETDSPLESINISNKMTEEDFVIFAHPNFITKKYMR